MKLLMKKLAGLALVLLGGLMIAHGSLVGPTWEIAPGVVLVTIGLVVLMMKITYRNSPSIRHASEQKAGDVAR
jgi:protein-S-isoprenylcysteine O-methyltransferase Ste14